MRSLFPLTKQLNIMKKRPTGVFKTENEYQKAIDVALYEKTPKAVFAAIAVSVMTNSWGVSFDNIDAALLQEWATLNSNGLVPQKAPRLNK